MISKGQGEKGKGKLGDGKGKVKGKQAKNRDARDCPSQTSSQLLRSFTAVTRSANSFETTKKCRFPDICTCTHATGSPEHEPCTHDAAAAWSRMPRRKNLPAHQRSNGNHSEHHHQPEACDKQTQPKASDCSRTTKSAPIGTPLTPWRVQKRHHERHLHATSNISDTAWCIRACCRSAELCGLMMNWQQRKTQHTNCWSKKLKHTTFGHHLRPSSSSESPQLRAVQALASVWWLTRFIQSGSTFSPKTWNTFFSKKKKNVGGHAILHKVFLVKDSLAHYSTHSNIHQPAHTTQHHTTRHNTTHSAPATLCNMTETQHHYFQHRPASFTVARGLQRYTWAICLMRTVRELAKAHALHPLLRCVAVALRCGLVLLLQLLDAGCWMLDAACLLVCLRVALVFMGLCVCGGCDSGCETTLFFRRHIMSHAEPLRATLRFFKKPLPSHSGPLSSHSRWLGAAREWLDSGSEWLDNGFLKKT